MEEAWSMQQFSIKQVEHLSGIKAHTLRIWEKRYHLIAPERNEGKQRKYSNEDLKTILRVVCLYNKGVKISKIASLKEKEIIERIRATDITDNTPVIIPQLLEACIDLDTERFESILKDLEIQYGLEAAIVRVIYPFLETVGLSWLTNRIHPANEHFASHLIEKRIMLATDKLNKNNLDGPSVLLFQPEGEHHEIPLLFINYLLLKNACRTVYFGSGIPVEEIRYYCNHHPVSHIFFHLITNLGNKDPDKYLQQLCNFFPGKIIVASGPCTRSIVYSSEQTVVLHSLNEMIGYIKNLHQSWGVALPH